MGGIGGGGAATELGEGGTPLEAVVVDLVVECQGLADDDMEERNSALTPTEKQLIPVGSICFVFSAPVKVSNYITII